MNLETIILIVLSILGIYFAIGVLFAIAFVTKGVRIIDPTAKDAPVMFRILLFPGSAGLWPVLLKKWLKAK